MTDPDVASPTLLLAKRLGDVANEANATGDHRTAARLYMRAVLALTSALPVPEDAEVLDEMGSSEHPPVTRVGTPPTR